MFWLHIYQTSEALARLGTQARDRFILVLLRAG